MCLWIFHSSNYVLLCIKSPQWPKHFSYYSKNEPQWLYSVLVLSNQDISKQNTNYSRLPVILLSIKIYRHLLLLGSEVLPYTTKGYIFHCTEKYPGNLPDWGHSMLPELVECCLVEWHYSEGFLSNLLTCVPDLLNPKENTKPNKRINLLHTLEVKITGLKIMEKSPKIIYKLSPYNLILWFFGLFCLGAIPAGAHGLYQFCVWVMLSEVPGYHAVMGIKPRSPTYK